MKKIQNSRRIAELETIVGNLSAATQKQIKTSRTGQTSKYHIETEPPFKSEKVLKHKDHQNLTGKETKLLDIIET